MRGVVLSSTHCGKKPTRQDAVRKDDEYCALCNSAAAAVAIGQLQLQLSHYSLVAFRLFASEMWLLRGPRGGLEKHFLGSLSLVIFSGPLINYAIIRPLTNSLNVNRLRYFTATCTRRLFSPCHTVGSQAMSLCTPNQKQKYGMTVACSWSDACTRRAVFLCCIV